MELLRQCNCFGNATAASMGFFCFDRLGTLAYSDAHECKKQIMDGKADMELIQPLFQRLGGSL